MRLPVLNSNHYLHQQQQEQQQEVSEKQRQTNELHDKAKLFDRYFLVVLAGLYITSVFLLVFIPLVKANAKFKKTKHRLGYESLWVH